MKINKVFWMLFVGVFFLGFTHNGFAQQYPTKPIRVIVPMSAGGANDVNARCIQVPLGEELKGKIVVEDIPGGSTKLGTMEVMKAEPDGYTLLLFSGTGFIAYYLSGTYDFKVWEKLTVIASGGETPWAVFEVRMDSPFKTWSDLVSFAKQNPGKLTCGGPAAGGMMNLIVAETAKNAGINVKYVPFAGSGKSNVALLGGHIDYRLAMLADAYPNIKSGQSRALATSYEKRLPELPDVPTFRELGFPLQVPNVGYEFFGPPNLPPGIVDQISKAVEKAVKHPSYIDYCKRTLYYPVFKDAQKLKEEMKSFEKNWGPIFMATYPKK